MARRVPWLAWRAARAIRSPELYLTQHQGSYGTTSTGRQYASYQGVRYAHPPTGPRRFLSPEPYTAEEGVWDVSTESTIACPQKSVTFGPDWEVAGQEDCLLLNIYSPDNHQQAPLPVLVWIHGGGLLFGSGTFQEHGPQHLLDRQVVVVTVNYRLGALGFLCLADDQVIPHLTPLLPGSWKRRFA